MSSQWYGPSYSIMKMPWVLECDYIHVVPFLYLRMQWHLYGNGNGVNCNYMMKSMHDLYVCGTCTGTK